VTRARGERHAAGVTSPVSYVGAAGTMRRTGDGKTDTLVFELGT
jgi:hypothetical protein